MPQGKGTYGKKKGRPPKKMMAGGATRSRVTKPLGSIPKMIPSGPRLEGKPRPRPRPRPIFGNTPISPEKIRQFARTPIGMSLPPRFVMPKMIARGGKVVKAERKAMDDIKSIGKEVMKKLSLAKGAVSDRELDKMTKRFTMDIVSKTKGAISDKEMEMFIKSSPNLGKKSSPKKKKTIRRGKPGYNRK